MPSDPMKRRAAARYLAVDIKPEDIAYARTRDRWGCAIVLAIQRELPDALRVRADAQEIAFSLPGDDTRYHFDTPPDVRENIMRPFDQGQPPSMMSFVLEAAQWAEPITHKNRAEMIQARMATRRARRKNPPRADRASGAARTVNRFLDATRAPLDDEDTE